MPNKEDNEPHSEHYRVAAKDWVEKESAASMLEEAKSAVLAQRMAMLGDIPVSHAERSVKASDEWGAYIRSMVDARKAANLAKVRMEYVKMRAMEEQSSNANKRAEMRLVGG